MSLNTYLRQYAFDKEKSSQLIKLVSDQYGMLGGKVMDFVSGRVGLVNANQFETFVLAWGVDQIEGTKLVSELFEESQIKLFSESRFEKKTVQFPMEFHCLQVSEDQWIGTIDVKRLTEMYNAQLINYNTNAQRVMKKVVRGGDVTYRIAINQKAVSEIYELMKLGRYIPNTITLNIPYDSEYSYNKGKETLTIFKADHFDIADGYHRLLAIRKVYEETQSNFNMELRLVSFKDEKTQQFIFQEDQKTKMAKLESASLNRYDLANNIIRSLNEEDYNFCWSGNIRRDGGIVNFADMSSLVSFFYIKGNNVPKGQERQTVNRIKEELRLKLNAVVDALPQLAEQKSISFMQLMIIMYCVRNFDDNKEIIEHIKSALDNIDKLDRSLYSSRRPRKGLVTPIKQII